MQDQPTQQWWDAFLEVDNIFFRMILLGYYKNSIGKQLYNPLGLAPLVWGVIEPTTHF